MIKEARDQGPSKQQQVGHAIARIINELESLDQGNAPRQRAPSQKTRDSLSYSVRKLVRDALGAASISRQGEAQISEGAGHYAASRYNKHLSYRNHVKKAYKGMIKLGYLTETKKGVAEKGIGLYQTKFVASKKLHKLIGPIRPASLHELIPLENNVDVIRVQRSQKIFLEGRAAPVRPTERVDYIDSPVTVEMRETVNFINALLDAAVIDLRMTAEQRYLFSIARQFQKQSDRVTTDLSRKGLYRVFANADFTEGGRFYGPWWQNIQSSLRAAIVINEQPTIECDYSNMHPTILYVSKGLQPPSDSYDGIIKLENTDNPLLPDGRSVVKRAFNAMLNAKAELKRPPQGLGLSALNIKWRDLSQRIIEKHAPIADVFYTGHGLRLQYEDSLLAEQVMLHFAVDDIPVLPVHDSFIVAETYETALNQVMRCVFTKRFGAEIKINRKNL